MPSATSWFISPARDNWNEAFARLQSILREREQRNQQRCENRNASCHGFVKEDNG
jgi:hypothetical protein